MLSNTTNIGTLGSWVSMRSMFCVTYWHKWNKTYCHKWNVLLRKHHDKIVLQSLYWFGCFLTLIHSFFTNQLLWMFHIYVTAPTRTFELLKGIARGVPMRGQIAVVYKIVKRINRLEYPNNLDAVVYQRMKTGDFQNKTHWLGLSYSVLEWCKK